MKSIWRMALEILSRSVQTRSTIEIIPKGHFNYFTKKIKKINCLFRLYRLSLWLSLSEISRRFPGHRDGEVLERFLIPDFLKLFYI